MSCTPICFSNLFLILYRRLGSLKLMQLNGKQMFGQSCVKQDGAWVLRSMTSSSGPPPSAAWSAVSLAWSSALTHWICFLQRSGPCSLAWMLAASRHPPRRASTPSSTTWGWRAPVSHTTIRGVSKPRRRRLPQRRISSICASVPSPSWPDATRAARCGGTFLKMCDGRV